MVSGMILKYSIKFFVTLIIVLFACSLAANASEFRAGERLVITKDQVINDDLYLAGSSIIVEGTINGDLIAAAGEIRVNGTVNGSLAAFGGSVTVNGNIANDIRTAGGTITLDGNVGDNALVFGGNLVLGKNARVNRDLTIGAGNAAIEGMVNGNINGGASNMEMRGTTAGNVTVNISNELRILPGAKIGGDLEYTAPRPAEISGTISGKTIYKETPEADRRDFLSGITGMILSYLWLLLTGIVLLTIAPQISRRISDNVSIKPLKNILWGILFLIIAPIVAVIFLITIIGIPLGLVLIAIWIIAVYVSRIFVGLWIGRYVLGRLKKETWHKALILAIGLLIVVIGINLPILGIFIHLVIILLGLGAIVLTGYETYLKLRGKDSV